MMVICLMVAVRNVSASTLGDAETVFNDYDKDISNLKRSIDMFDRIISERKDTDTIYEACWMRSRAYATMGDYPELTGTDALSDYEVGKRSAEEAIKINPDGEKGYFWYAVNLGKAGQLKGVLNALFMLPEFQKNLDKAYTLDPADPWVLIAYGALYYNLPWIVGGSNFKALHYLKKALAVAPNFTVAMVVMGKVYIQEDKYDMARQILEKVIQCKNPAARADWFMYDLPTARKLLHSISE